LLSQQRYLPFGQVRTDVGTVSETDFGYTGQRALGDLGLMDYHARMYDPALGRFVQPDTIIPSANSPQSWNRFSYVQNNPINRTDPTGHNDSWWCDSESNSASCNNEYQSDANGVIGGHAKHKGDNSSGSSSNSSNLLGDCIHDIAGCYMQGWNNFGNAWSTFNNPNAHYFIRPIR
jgi:RHS repeat-associated protein